MLKEQLALQHYMLLGDTAVPCHLMLHIVIATCADTIGIVTEMQCMSSCVSSCSSHYLDKGVLDHFGAFGAVVSHDRTCYCYLTCSQPC